MAILVTGGEGFIGGHLVDRLIERGEYVVSLDDMNDYYDPKKKFRNLENHTARAKGNFLFIQGDIRDRKAVEKAFSSADVRTVVHLAARAGVRPSLIDPNLYYDVNVTGTVNMLETARMNKVDNFIFGSSSSVYGTNEKVPFSEDDLLNNLVSPYAASKLAGEKLCKLYNTLYALNTICLRFFTVYGPRGRPDMAIYKFTEAVSSGRPIEVYGDGDTMRDYTYVSDIIDGIDACLGKRFGFEILNLGDNNPVPLTRLVELIESNVGKKAVKLNKGPQKGDVPKTYADITKARRLLGYDPKVKIESGIEKFVSWYKKESGN